MGRIVGRIANDEPDRLARMMNTKQRLIGVGHPIQHWLLPRCAGRHGMSPIHATCMLQVDVQSLDSQVLEKSTIKASTRQTEA
jgi:hypothetical protein